MLIRDLLNSKSDVLLTVLPTADIRESAALMIDHSVSALMVLTEDDPLPVSLRNATSRDFLPAIRGTGTHPYRKS